MPIVHRVRVSASNVGRRGPRTSFGSQRMAAMKPAPAKMIEGSHVAVKPKMSCRITDTVADPSKATS